MGHNSTPRGSQKLRNTRKCVVVQDLSREIGLRAWFSNFDIDFGTFQWILGEFGLVRSRSVSSKWFFDVFGLKGGRKCIGAAARAELLWLNGDCYDFRPASVWRCGIFNAYMPAQSTPCMAWWSANGFCWFRLSWSSMFAKECPGRNSILDINPTHRWLRKLKKSHSCLFSDPHVLSTIISNRCSLEEVSPSRNVSRPFSWLILGVRSWELHHENRRDALFTLIWARRLKS